MEEMDPEQTTEQAGQIGCGEKWGGRSGLWRWHESRTDRDGAGMFRGK